MNNNELVTLQKKQEKISVLGYLLAITVGEFCQGFRR